MNTVGDFLADLASALREAPIPWRAKFGPGCAEGDKTGDKKKHSKRRTHGTN